MVRGDDLMGAGFRLATSYERLLSLRQLKAPRMILRRERSLLRRRLRAFRQELARMRRCNPYDQPLGVEELEKPNVAE